MSISITPMTCAHIVQVSKLELLCFRVPWSEQAFANEMENNLAYYSVMLDDEDVIGYYGMWRVLDEGHITNIAIHPNYRRKGLGSRMIAHMIQTAEDANVHHLTLEVRASNTPAQGLYAKYGFKPSGLRRRYYSDNNEDAIIMTKIW